MKKEVLDLRKDTTLRQLFRDTALRKSFVAQFRVLRVKWNNTDSLVRASTNAINNLKARASANDIAVAELLYQTSDLLAKTGPRAFSKERNYLWEPTPGHHKAFSEADNLKKSLDNENKAIHYYFFNTRSKRLWLLLTGVVFFCWIFINYRRLKKINKLPLPETFQFKFINPVPIAACLVCMLILAPLKKAFTDIVQQHADILSQRQPEILFTYLKGKTVQLLFLFWCNDIARLDSIKSEVSKEVYEMLQQKGINIV